MSMNDLETDIRAIEQDYTGLNRRIKPWRNAAVEVYGRCYWCHRPLVQGNATVDHLLPKSRYPVWNPDWMVLACSPCNARRGDHDARLPMPIPKVQHKRLIYWALCKMIGSGLTFGVEDVRELAATAARPGVWIGIGSVIDVMIGCESRQDQKQRDRHAGRHIKYPVVPVPKLRHGYASADLRWKHAKKGLIHAKEKV